MKKLLFSIALVFAISGIKAQSYELVIRMNDDTETTWNSESLRNIYFENDETLILVESESLFTHSYEFADIEKIYFKSGIAITELNKETALFVYPNPAKDNIKIIGIDNQEIEIISIDGKSMFKGNYDGASLDVSNFPQGTYIINIQNNVQTLKFSKI
ncbi:MAG: T9SS type A sorting domain-containing protein [Bacteroidales bacterium]|nr:T9SS type A sorting domain-containing protein [Bacteroidales bacterium]